MAERKRLFAGNWKMYKTREEAKAFVEGLTEQLATANINLKEQNSVKAVICAPFTALPGLADRLKVHHVAVGAQNMHEAEVGAYTGEVSAAMLQDVGCQYVILGHSERRAYFAETDAGVAKKTIVAIHKGLIPIVCVGETLTEREANQTQTVISTQMEAVLDELVNQSDQIAVKEGQFVIAYEPVWAIGTGKSSSADDAQAVIGFIRSLIAKRLGEATAQAVGILYGGSVKPDNIKTYLSMQDIDGALVGGASLQPDSYTALLVNSF